MLTIIERSVKDLFAFPDKNKSRVDRGREKHVFRQDLQESAGRFFPTDADSTQSDTPPPSIPVAAEVDSGSNDEIYKVNFDETELVGMTDDDIETNEIDNKIEQFYRDNPYRVNRQLAKMVIEGLEKLEVPEPSQVMANWSPYRFQGAANLIEACERTGLHLYYGEVQINAFLNYIQEKHYTVTTISSHFATIKLIGKLLGKKPSPKNMIKYRFVRNHRKKLKDNKVPVGRLCLLQLCAAVDLVLMGCTCLLAKTMFLCAYAFSMRISEFSRTTAKNNIFEPSHNITGNSVFTSNIGISACFDSDKTSKFDSAIRHRTVKWYKLPDFTRPVVEMYISLRPKANHFFCMRDGQELSRGNVLNILDACLLLTDYAHLKVTPHSFRQGMCSEDALAESDPNRIRFVARWSNKSDGSEPYMRSDLVGITLIEIWKRNEKYHRL